MFAWRALPLPAYRAALKARTLSCDIYFEQPPRPELPTLVFIHGSFGAPSHFAPVAERLEKRANCAAFVWDCNAALVPTAEVLRAALSRLRGSVSLVAHSMGALLPAYAGATDRAGDLRRLGALYLNPLIGGSRYAGDFRLLAWLGIGRMLQRLLFRPSFADLAPESEFQQTIYGRSAEPSSFAGNTLLLFTERKGREPDIPAARVPYYFGRTREEIMRHLGTLVPMNGAQAEGHKLPLRQPEIVVSALERLFAPAKTEAGPCS